MYIGLTFELSERTDVTNRTRRSPTFGSLVEGMTAVISRKSDDAKHYQERQVMLKIQESKK
jgi:hypothetical protein